jgi:hypothetical protein
VGGFFFGRFFGEILVFLTPHAEKHSKSQEEFPIQRNIQTARKQVTKKTT